MDVDITAKKQEITEPQMENYEDWKKRILDNAYKQLKKLHSVDKHKQNPKSNKERGSPTKHKQNENLKTANENLKIERSSPRKHKHIDNWKKQNDISNKQNDNSNTQNADTNINALIFNVKQFPGRRSPRKTPQKFEPYKSPDKIKGVRLLFP